MAIVESVGKIPLQDPPEEEFCAADLTWTKFGNSEHHDEVPFIPYDRVDAFIIGECSNVECTTRFHIERGKKPTIGSLKDYKDDEYLEYRLYWCSFGPENYGEEAYYLVEDDQASIRMWIERNRKSGFFPQDTSESDPFILGIQTEWQLQKMIHFGHRSVVAADSTFGVNRLKYPLFTLVFYSRQHALPVAWVITRSFAKPAEIDLLRSWLRNIVKKCSNIEIQWEIFKRLGTIVYSIWGAINASLALEQFMLDFVDQTAFMEYFKVAWLPNLEMWLSTMRNFPLASQEASGALEAYHNVKEKYIASTSWHRALQIPDYAVSLDDKDHLFAKVVSQKDSSLTHIVWNPGSEFASRGSSCSTDIGTVVNNMPPKWVSKKGRTYIGQHMFYADQRTVIAEIIRAWLVVGDQMEETKKFWCICFVQPLYLAILLGISMCIRDSLGSFVTTSTPCSCPLLLVMEGEAWALCAALTQINVATLVIKII
ncbi:hypothetical protein D0Y65_021336 [Glycine soja]|uniref:Uncharacterized protein n=1 Tax=Glycine soja TaxID=3848 RepID=A0A445JIM2_GLYSO|nr:hypothetical protein D0Y65_021336 [Glycine soja]